MVGSAIGPFLHFELLRLNELLYFTCGRKLIKENAIFADPLAYKHMNSRVDHRGWAAKVSLRCKLTGFHIAVNNIRDQARLPVPLVLTSSHTEGRHETEHTY